MVAFASGYLTCRQFGLNKLEAERELTEETRDRLEAEKRQLEESVELALQSRSKIDGDRLRILRFSKKCPGCGATEWVRRGPRCYGVENVCPRTQVHHHSRCIKEECHADWIEVTIDETINQLEVDDEKRKKGGKV